MTRHADASGEALFRRPSARRAAALTITALLAVLAALTLASPPADALGQGSAPDLAAVAGLDAADPAARPAATGVALGSSRAKTLRAQADALRKRARTAQQARLFTRATRLYDRARNLYVAAGATLPARACLTAAEDIYLITGTYSETRAEMLADLEMTYPDSTAAQRRAWLDLPSTERMRWDGVVHYFSDVAMNLAYRNIELFQAVPEWVVGYEDIYAELVPYLAVAAETPAWQQYGKPTAYDFAQTLSVPRDELPASGILRTWFPIPINTGPQTDVVISDITPDTYLRYPPSTDQAIGLLYMRVPLEGLSGDLDVSFHVGFKHAAQYFKVDPGLVGRYDTSGALYRRYTRSHANTRITPSIRRTAQRVVAGETNPYLAAQRLYRFIVRRVKYSHMPHFAMWPRGVPESVYVHEHRYGDCGAQSIYFSALCRSIGIPARTTGGFQIFGGIPAGHFWAEFYLPNYGWVPVDPTAATMVDYLPDVSAADKQAFHDFYFSNQDDLRLVVQKDVDLPLLPRAQGRVLLPMAIQMPAALCSTMETIPGFVLAENWTFDLPLK